MVSTDPIASGSEDRRPMTPGSFSGLDSRGFHRIAYYDWPAPASSMPPVVCVHGLTRTGRDFDRLAEHLSADRRVVCPDMAGRGRSERLADPKDYGFPQYLADCVALLARVDAPRIDWIGTSMGGLIGMFLAAKANTPIRRLVLNDVGPFLPKAALARIGEYVGRAPRFASLPELESHLRQIHAPFGQLSDSDWAHLARSGHWRDADGSYRQAYDPAIAETFKGEPADVDLWATWQAVTCPVLILRGATSDLLTAEVAARMRDRAAPTRLVEIPATGHAPALMDPGQIGIVRDWLAGP